jgi:hypothetical protein
MIVGRIVSRSEFGYIDNTKIITPFIQEVKEVLTNAGYQEQEMFSDRLGFATSAISDGTIIWPVSGMNHRVKSQSETEALVRQYQGVLQAAGYKVTYCPPLSSEVFKTSSITCFRKG